MKSLGVFIKLLCTAALCFPLLFLVNCGNGGTVPEPEGVVVEVWDLLDSKQHYIIGETYDTKGNMLSVLYADGTRGKISCGFTQEWAKHYDIYDGDFWEWFYDSSQWSPIKHGDPLPVSPSALPGYGSATFFVRADYKGMKSDVRYRSVSR